MPDMYKYIALFFLSLGGVLGGNTVYGMDFFPEHIVEAAINDALRICESYKEEAREKLKDYVYAAINIAKFKRLGENWCFVPQDISEISHDPVVIVLDAGFSDVALSYRNDVIAIYDMDKFNGSLNKLDLAIKIPSEAWDLYKKQSDLGVPLRVLQHIAKKVPQLAEIIYPSFNLIKNTNYGTLSSEFAKDLIIYDGQGYNESKYHGAQVVYTLKEWAPKAKLILVRYDLSNSREENEARMLQDLHGIAKTYNVKILIRSMTGKLHWAGLEENVNLLRDVLIIAAAPDSAQLALFHKNIRMPKLLERANFIFANTFSTGNNNLIRIPARGANIDQFRQVEHLIGQFSFESNKLETSILEASNVFINRHMSRHCYNQDSLVAQKLEHDGYNFSIACETPTDITGLCSVRPHYLMGDSSSAVPVIAAWAIYLMKKKENEQWPDVVRNRIVGIANNDAKPCIFQDPIAWGEFTIFEQGYAEGLMVPRKPEYWIKQQ